MSVPSGPRADEVVPCFSAGPLDDKVLGDEIGKASALKMCYAANTKGAVALLAGILATAESLGVREALFHQWKGEDPELPDQIFRRIQANAPKAWRFVGEMKEISRTFSEAGCPRRVSSGCRRNLWPPGSVQRRQAFTDARADSRRAVEKLGERTMKLGLEGKVN